MQDVRLPLQILSQAAKRLGLVMENCDDVTHAVVRVSNSHRHFFAGIGKIGMYPLNPHFAAALASDKAWSYQALSQAGFTVPKGKHFFLSDDWKEYRPAGRDSNAALTYAAELGYPVFAKPNDGSSGVLAELLLNEVALKEHLLQIAQVSYVALVQEYINLPEYRIFVIDDHVEFMYRRTKPVLVGDGKHTIGELITIMNSQIPIVSHQIKINSPFIKSELVRLDLTLDTVLAQGNQLVVAAHANLASGGAMVELTYTVPKWLHEWSARVAHTLGLRVAGIDVFSRLPMSDSTAEADLIIIEVNSNPNLAGIYKNDGADAAVKVWEKILLKYFKYK